MPRKRGERCRSEGRKTMTNNEELHRNDTPVTTPSLPSVPASPFKVRLPGSTLAESDPLISLMMCVEMKSRIFSCRVRERTGKMPMSLPPLQQRRRLAAGLEGVIQRRRSWYMKLWSECPRDSGCEQSHQLMPAFVSE